jgi:2-polyprenyl-3-methyl-5-hydroxy-6-metoxy-1,4-benzoquinol methylase
MEDHEGHERWDEIWSAKQRLTSGRLTSGLARDVIYRTVLSILKKEVQDARGKRMLEVGSGTGLVSLALAKRGADVTLCDISPEAVKFSKAVFAKEGVHGTTVEGSLLDLPFEKDSFDVTWNAGVVEHFKHDDQVRGLQEMLRVTKPEGKVIVAVPSARASIYLRAKAYADRRSAWQPGYEVPMDSLADLAREVPAELVAEYRIGALAELHFLKYYFARPRWLRFAWSGLVEILSLALSPLNNRPGYLLVSVLKKTR